MRKIKALNSNTYEKEHESEKYYRALQRFLSKYPDIKDFEDRTLSMKMTFLEVKYLATYSQDKSFIDMESALTMFKVFSQTTYLLSKFTPIEFMHMFPIRKTYDGEKYQMKDYFSTMEEISKYDQDKPIGEEGMQHLLYDYQNRDIINFQVKKLTSMSYLRKCQGEKGLMEEFCEMNNVPTYSYYKDQGILIENGTGKCIKAKPPKKRIPKSLKIIK